MNYESFLTQIVDRGIAAATADYGDEAPNKLKGSIDGFDACRGLSPQQLIELLQKARNRANLSMQLDEPIDLYWELRCYEMEVEWVCNVVSAALANEGQPPLLGYLPTARGMMTAAEILGVRGTL